MNNVSVDAYLQDGCGRCEHFRTAKCKVHSWRDILVDLRELVLGAGLVEEMKWGSPCYTLGGKNVLMLSALKDRTVLGFFKGAALRDEAGLLERPGPNSRYVRYLVFRSAGDVSRLRAQATQLIQQAMEIEREGVRVTSDHDPDPVPVELAERFATDADLRKAFDELTPGRQRSHILFINGAKQRATRERRVEKCAHKILKGQGFNER